MNRTRVPSEAEGGEDVFGSRVETPRASEDASTRRRERRSPSHHLRGRIIGQEQISGSQVSQLEFDTRGGVRSEGGMSEGEGWVDTDVDGTDSDIGGEGDEIVLY